MSAFDRSAAAFAFVALLLPCATHASGKPETACARTPLEVADRALAQSDIMRNYLAVRHAPGFHTEPFVLHRMIGNKRLTVIGTRHVSNPDSPMYRSITRTIDAASPQLILHEGEAPADLAQQTAPQAIRRAADLGFIAHYAKLHGIAFRSADAPVDAEINALLNTHSARDVLVS